MRTERIGFEPVAIRNDNGRMVTRAVPVISSTRSTGKCYLSDSDMEHGINLSPILKQGDKRNSVCWVKTYALRDAAQACESAETTPKIPARATGTLTRKVVHYFGKVGRVFYLCPKTNFVPYAEWSTYHAEENANKGFEACNQPPNLPTSKEPSQGDDPDANSQKEPEPTTDNVKEPADMSDDKERAVLDAIKELANGDLHARVKKLEDGESGAITQATIDGLLEKVELLESQKTIELELPDWEGIDSTTISCLEHKDFKKALTGAMIGRHVMLVGPAGTGKTYMANMIAAAMGLPCYLKSCSEDTQAQHLFGRRSLINGSEIFIPGMFTKAYSGYMFEGKNEKGKPVRKNFKPGVLILDEYDALFDNTTISMNGPLSFDSLTLDELPLEDPAPRHEDFKLIAIGNTYGTGGDYIYSRNRQDGAALSRFDDGASVLFIDYDVKLETALVKRAIGNSDADMSLAEALWKLRRNVAANQTQRVVGSRALIGGYEWWCKGGDTPKAIVERIVQGWTPDDREQCMEGVLELL